MLVIIEAIAVSARGIRPLQASIYRRNDACACVHETDIILCVCVSPIYTYTHIRSATWMAIQVSRPRLTEAGTFAECDRALASNYQAATRRSPKGHNLPQHSCEQLPHVWLDLVRFFVETKTGYCEEYRAVLLS